VLNKAGTSRSESKLEAGRRTSGSVDGKKNTRAESRLKKDPNTGGGGSQSPNRNSSSLSQNPNPNLLLDGLDGTASMDGGHSSAVERPSQKLQRFRWLIGANAEITIRLRFTSDECGQFDQTLNFEIVGTRRRYQLHCRGVCTFPTISREPRIVFPSRKKAREVNEIVQKKYILAEDLFEFGPLLVGNNKERCVFRNTRGQ
jgi:hydrocephalus-inducing protein